MRQLVLDEGMELKPYKCTAGANSLGVGRNLDEKGISAEEAMYLLGNDVDSSLKELSQFDWFEKLSDVRKAAVINMHFNLGHTRFRGFKKMIKALESQDFEEAARQMLDSKWARQVGARAQRLATEIKSGVKIK